MSNPVYAGMVTAPGRWHSGVKLGGVNAFPIEWIVDPALPQLFQELPYPSRDFCVIPRGRAVAAKATDLTNLAGETTVTLANGVDPLNAPAGLTGNLPIGYAPFHIYRTMQGLPPDRPTITHDETIEVPYTAINESYCNANNGGSRLLVGELLMPFFGSAVSVTPTPNDVGKYVRYIPTQVFLGTPTASSTVTLDRAIYPAFKPKVLGAFTNNGTFVASGATVAWNAGLGKWTAAFAGTTMTSVLYEWGASEGQAIGRLLGVEPVGTAGGINSSSHEMAGWLKWVTDEFGSWDWPPIMQVSPQTSVTDEVVSVSSNSGVLAHAAVVPWKTITVKVTGTVTNADGTTTTLAGDTLALADLVTFNDYTKGLLYDIDFLSGRIQFSTNLSITAVTVSYYYETSFKNGLTYDRGIFGLTDGRTSGIVGLPPHLDVAGVRGAMRIAIQGR